MKPDKQRKALGKWDGYTFERVEKHSPYDETVFDLDIWTNSKGRETILPDYLSDLNAVHKLEGQLLLLPKNPLSGRLYADWHYYVRHLERIDRYTYGYAIHATAAQRCEALLKTLGLWTEETQQPPTPKV